MFGAIRLEYRCDKYAQKPGTRVNNIVQPPHIILVHLSRTQYNHISHITNNAILYQALNSKAIGVISNNAIDIPCLNISKCST